MKHTFLHHHTHTLRLDLDPAELFLEADSDHSGYLDRSEFTRVLQHANLNLSDRQVGGC